MKDGPLSRPSKLEPPRKAEITARNVVVGQKIGGAKLARSRQLRSQMTEGERILWQSLRAHRLNGLHFRRQQVIDGFIVDFYCHAGGLVVEVDGGVHAYQVEYDRERDWALTARGLQVLRITDEEVRRDLQSALDRIRAALEGD